MSDFKKRWQDQRAYTTLEPKDRVGAKWLDSKDFMFGDRGPGIEKDGVLFDGTAPYEIIPTDSNLESAEDAFGRLPNSNSPVFDEVDSLMDDRLMNRKPQSMGLGHQGGQDDKDYMETTADPKNIPGDGSENGIEFSEDESMLLASEDRVGAGAIPGGLPQDGDDVLNMGIEPNPEDAVFNMPEAEAARGFVPKDYEEGSGYFESAEDVLSGASGDGSIDPALQGIPEDADLLDAMRRYNKNQR